MIAALGPGLFGFPEQHKLHPHGSAVQVLDVQLTGRSVSLGGEIASTDVLADYNPESLGRGARARRPAFQQRPESLFQSGQLRLPRPA